MTCPPEIGPGKMLDLLNELERGFCMGRRTFTPEQIINKLREAEVHLSQGETVGEASRRVGVTEQTYYR